MMAEYDLDPNIGRLLYLDCKSGQSTMDDKGRITKEDVYVKALVDTWNTLITRTTTMIDDIYLILANLLDYNSYQFSKLPSKEDKMKAMFWSTHKIPVSLLYNKSPQHRASKDHRDRWLPIELRGDQLSRESLLECTEEGLRHRY